MAMTPSSKADTAAAAGVYDDRASTQVDPATAADLEAVQEIAAARLEIAREIEKRIVGQSDVIDHLLTALFARGHCLFVGVLRGPIFANLILADEINRTPPKTQAALLQSMQEYRVTAGGQTYELALPFLVFATQNPIEQEGTYPLPEAQLDRFMFQVDVGYPSEAEEQEIVRQETSNYVPELRPVLSPERIIQLQELVLRVPAADHVIEYAVALTRRSRPGEAAAPDFVREFVSWGAGPRASKYLILAGKARALLDGRYAVSREDVRALARPTLQHRILLNYRAEAEGVRSGEIVDRLLAGMRLP